MPDQRRHASSRFLTPTDRAAAPLPHLQAPFGEEQRAETEALTRAMSVQRLTANGMAAWDANALHAMAAEGVEWTEAGEWLADRNTRLAEQAIGRADTATARAYFLYASCCYRAAQAALPRDSDRKRRIYLKLLDRFGAGGRLDNPAFEPWQVEYEGAKLCGWLIYPASGTPSPVVIVLGGFDAWREEYYAGATYLVERGVTALLLDLPGQGETRLFQGLYLKADFDKAVSRVVDRLLTDRRLSGRVGIWGNSFGGFLAAKAAASDPRLGGCCVNGGTVDPAEFPRRFPRFLDRVGAMLGIPDDAEALSAIERFTLDAAQIRCPLLQLHAENDPVFPLSSARKIYDCAQSEDKNLFIWEDGDHCIHSHYIEKYTTVADWFRRLLC